MRFKYVNAEQGLRLMERGYELSGRGMAYCSYRFTKEPGSDIVDYWRVDHNDNGSWTVDEFLSNMTSVSGTPMLALKVRDDMDTVMESKRPVGKNRVFEARGPQDPMPSDSALEKLWMRKRDLLCEQDSRFRYMTFWKWNDMPLAERNRRLLMLVTFNFRMRDNAGNQLTEPGWFFGAMRNTVWKDLWVEGLNSEFDTTLTKDDYREAVKYYAHPRNMDNRDMAVRENSNIRQLTPTKRQTSGKYVKNARYSTCFRELYNVITDPLNAAIYKGRYKQKALSGLRGRPREGQTYIEFNMEKLPITMLRSKDGNKTYSEDEPLVYCISGADKLRPDAVFDDKIDYYTQIKKFMHRYSNIPYAKMTPCSLDYWMKNISRRFKSDRKSQEDKAMRFELFQKTSILQLKEDGEFRFWQNGMTDKEGWQPDPCLDYELVQCVEDDEIENAAEE